MSSTWTNPSPWVRGMLRVDLRDDVRAVCDRGAGDVHRDAQRAEAVRVGRRDLDQRDVEREHAGAEQPRDLAQEDRHVVGAPLLDRLADVRADEERVDPEAPAYSRRGVGAAPSVCRWTISTSRSSPRARRHRLDEPAGAAATLWMKTRLPDWMTETASAAETMRKMGTLLGRTIPERPPGRVRQNAPYLADEPLCQDGRSVTSRPPTSSPSPAASSWNGWSSSTGSPSSGESAAIVGVQAAGLMELPLAPLAALVGLAVAENVALRVWLRRDPVISDRFLAGGDALRHRGADRPAAPLRAATSTPSRPSTS